MLQHKIIGPGRHGNYLVGYIRTGTRQFMPLADCNTKGQAEDALADFEAQARQRSTVARTDMTARGIRGFYNDDE